MDSLSLVRLPGIGPALARRILAFRQKLGGFYDVEQIRETYGLPDSTFQVIRKFFRNSDLPVQQIDINVAGVEEMKSHPLLRYQLAKAIVAYREQHGNFARVEDIKQIYTITGELYNRVSPYLVVH
jgi:competence ComEA-like helix-hairpin-helix protein